MINPKKYYSMPLTALPSACEELAKQLNERDGLLRSQRQQIKQLQYEIKRLKLNKNA